ncbi:hypothetical protein L1887_32542 [Cichorium endivia]|nr:hypothetical protein L1887_32542 [Cichorium endivia]
MEVSENKQKEMEVLESSYMIRIRPKGLLVGPNQKYCERHAHKTRLCSTKPVDNHHINSITNTNDTPSSNQQPRIINDIFEEVDKHIECKTMMNCENLRFIMDFILMAIEKDMMETGNTFVVLLHLDDLYESPKKGLGGYHHHNAHISTTTPSLNQPNLRLHGLPLPLLPPPDHHRHNNITRASITVVLASKK